MKTYFHSHFYAKFHASILNFAILVQISKTKQLGMIYTILGSFCSFFNWEGTDIRPKIRHRKIPGNEFCFSEVHEVMRPMASVEN